MDIYAEITNRLTAEMERGIIPWRKPWMAAGRAVSHTTGKPYSLLNQMLLGKAGEYLTFNECRKEGGYVRRGEKAHMVVFWRWIDKEDEETGEVKQIPFLRYYSVFHIDQCEGIKARFPVKLARGASADETAEGIVAGYVTRSGVRLEHVEVDRAFYQPSADRIVLPLRAQFKGAAEYYGTVFHEMVHSTDHASRLNRLETTAYFGNEQYSKEELVAEIGSAALVNRAGLETSDSFRNSAAYVQNWL